MTQETAWTAGRFDARRGPKRILFGRMYEDTEVERGVFRPGGRVFCIASAGCTALDLCDRYEVVACDINPTQLAYAERRIAGSPVEVGTAEKVMGFGRALMPLAGWRRDVVRAFLALSDPGEQVAFWKAKMDTWRFRTAFGALMSGAGLRAVYAPAFLDFLPPSFGAVLRARMARAFGLHPNATNPYAHSLLMGDSLGTRPVPREAAGIKLVQADAASYLESCRPGAFDAFTLSNILDGARPEYRNRLMKAVRHAASEDAVVVLRSFGEPRPGITNLAERDRAILWGTVELRPASAM